jgi:glucan biosynthesis protein C
MSTSIQVRIPWVDHLRSFITLLVIAHHSALAYTSFSSFNSSVYILSTHPVVDTRRWALLDLFAGFNDTFFMSLMFLISGIFTLPGLQKKGAASFLADRFRRLIIPFLIAVTLLMWVAYYPAWLLSGRSSGVGNYLVDFFTLEAWPVGPPWFIWLLFLFNLIIALLYKPLMAVLPAPASSGHNRRPGTRSFLLFVILTALLYVPPAIILGSFTWTGIGPFDFQESRLLLYFGYFLFGAIIGQTGLENVPVKRWPLWIAGSMAAYVLQALMLTEGNVHHLAFALSISVSSMAFLTIFKALFTRSNGIWRSLSVNAYGMYLVHYIFVVWCQYALLPVDWPAGIKFMAVFIFSLLASWMVTDVVRRSAVVRGVI